jgi:hypothetical protein
MRIRTGSWGVLLASIFAGTLASNGALGQPGKERREERREEAKERREERREEAKERREERREEAKERREERREEAKERRDDRQDRRRAARRAFLDKWGPIHKRAPVRAELATHARRMARLTYMKTLATEAGKTELVTKIDKNIANEQARHDKKMEQLKQAKEGEQ